MAKTCRKSETGDGAGQSEFILDVCMSALFDVSYTGQSEGIWIHTCDTGWGHYGAASFLLAAAMFYSAMR